MGNGIAVTKREKKRARKSSRSRRKSIVRIELPRRVVTRGFPAEYRNLRAPNEKRSWLTRESQGLIEAGAITVDEILRELSRLNKDRDRVAAKAPTPAWVEEYERGSPFPPRADDPLCQMRPCVTCGGRLYPRFCTRGEICDDCRMGLMQVVEDSLRIKEGIPLADCGGSASAKCLDHLKRARERLRELDLPAGGSDIEIDPSDTPEETRKKRMTAKREYRKLQREIDTYWIGPRRAGGLHLDGRTGWQYRVVWIAGDRMKVRWESGEVEIHGRPWDYGRDAVVKPV